MKKKIVICVFLLLIFITAIISIISAIYSYNYDIDPNNGVYLLEGFGAVFSTFLPSVKQCWRHQNNLP